MAVFAHFAFLFHIHKYKKNIYFYIFYSTQQHVYSCRFHFNSGFFSMFISVCSSSCCLFEFLFFSMIFLRFVCFFVFLMLSSIFCYSSSTLLFVYRFFFLSTCVLTFHAMLLVYMVFPTPIISFGVPLVVVSFVFSFLLNFIPIFPLLLCTFAMYVICIYLWE